MVQQLLLSRHCDESGESPGLAGAGATSRRRDAKVPRTAPARLGKTRCLDLNDQPFGHKAVEIAIEHAWPQAHVSAGPFQHFVHHTEAVQVAIGECEQDLEPVRR